MFYELVGHALLVNKQEVDYYYIFYECEQIPVTFVSCSYSVCTLSLWFSTKKHIVTTLKGKKTRKIFMIFIYNYLENER
jgi:hypothetical protein